MDCSLSLRDWGQCRRFGWNKGEYNDMDDNIVLYRTSHITAELDSRTVWEFSSRISGSLVLPDQAHFGFGKTVVVVVTFW